MRKLFLIMNWITWCQLSFAQTLSELQSKSTRLPNGWNITQVGNSLPLGDLPLNLVVSSSKRYLAVTNNGQSVQSVQLIDAIHDKVLSTEIIPRSWYGLKFSSDEK